MHGQALHESLARERHHYERLVYARMRETITWEDAEDIVSDALVRVESKCRIEPPRRGKEDAWFTQVVMNQGIDFLRGRDGRKRERSLPRPELVPIAEIIGNGHEPIADEDLSIGALLLDELDEPSERRQASEIVGRVMAKLDPKDAELVKLRHLVGTSATREETAAMVGMTLGEFRTRYARAWSHFVDAVALDAPTERCQHVRQLLGEVTVGTAPAEAVHEIDAHALGCASCRVFARESYRALELIPFAPVVGFAERWSARVGWWWERSGPEASAGAGTAGAGAGIWALLGGGGAAGLLKTAAIVCSATAVTAAFCAGVIEVIDDLSEPKKTQAAAVERSTPRQATPTPGPTVAPTRTPTPKRPTRTRPRKTSADLSGESQIPASAPAGSSEFNPSASSARRDPAPAPVAGGGEFAP